jgi:flagellar biogenesis protein FliO
MRGFVPRRLAWALALALAFLAFWPGRAAAQENAPAAADAERPLGTDDRLSDPSDPAAERAPGLRRTGSRPWREAGSADAARPSFGRRYIETLGWLVLVVLLAVGSIWLLRRFAPGSVHPQNRRLVQVIGRGALGPKHQVVVTRVGERILILGLTSDSIVRLGEVEDPREAIRLTPPDESFAGTLTLSEAAYRDEDVVRPGVDDATLEPYRREIERLKGMVELWQRQELAPPERGIA